MSLGRAVRHSGFFSIGASLKDLGKRWFSFNKMEMKVKELLEKLKDTRKKFAPS